MKSNLIRVGTRGSELALAQTKLVIDRIKQSFPGLGCEIIVITTIGDKVLNKSLLEFGGKAVFVTEFEDALIKGEIDLAVHSAKDMPMELSEGLVIAGVLQREDPRDVLISKKGLKIEEMNNAVIGTSSLRRKIQIEHLYSNFTTKDIRGNVNTRLNKLFDGLYDGIVLAAAGMKRLQLDNLESADYRYFEFVEMVPAAGQGIIAIEARKDCEISKMISTISDKKSEIELETERAVLNLLEAGCHEPIGIFSEVIGEKISLQIMKEYGHKTCNVKDSIDNICNVKGEAFIENRFELVQDLVRQLLEEI